MTYAERLEAARRLLLSGQSYNAVAERMHMCAKALERNLPGFARWKWTPLTADQRAQGERLLADGCSRNEVARSIGVTKSRAHRAFPDQCWTEEQSIEYRRMLRLLDPADRQDIFINGPEPEREGQS